MNNQITEIPDMRWISSLRELWCSHNQLTRLPNVYDIEHSRLEIFMCHGNDFDGSACADIEAVEAMDLSLFMWNPQSDLSELDCDE